MFTVPPSAGSDPAPLFHKLNRGPNLRGITHANHDSRLPRGWNLSFGRVSPVAFDGDTRWHTTTTVSVFQEFERACAQILRSDRGPRVRAHVLGGVITEDWVKSIYLGATTPFSVRRLDIVVNQHGPAVCENDEMPGGLTHAYWLDYAYGVNQDRWAEALNWLTRNGALVFAVSTAWSAPYIPEILWLANHLRSRGFEAHVLTDSDAGRLQYKRRGVFLDGKKVGVVWRLFPVFEAHGAFAGVVKAAHDGKLALVPELASWGNKAWMGVFWQERAFFQQAMSAGAFNALSGLLPYTRLVSGADSFPMATSTNDGLIPFNSLEELKRIPQRYRRQTVAKLCGANTRAARSHGVVIGTSASGSRWGEALDQMVRLGAPVAIQQYRQPSRMTVPVWSVLNGGPQFEAGFTGKVLIRPWAINGKLVTATAFVTTPDTTKLHGTTTGAEVPVRF